MLGIVSLTRPDNSFAVLCFHRTVLVSLRVGFPPWWYGALYFHCE